MTITDGRDYLDDIKKLIIEYYKRLNRDLTFQNIDDELKDLAEKYCPPHGRILAALDEEGHTVGCIAYHKLNDQRCEMKRLFVDPEYRGHHAGSLLIEEIERLAKEDGYTEMVLDTIVPLQAAIHLYHSHGFKECNPYYDNPMDDVIYMSKTL